MKLLLSILLLFSFSLCSAQTDHQLTVEAIIDDGPDRVLLLKNMSNANKAFTSVQMQSGSGLSETLGAFICYNNFYTAIPDFHGYVSILSGSNSKDGRGINFIGQKSYANFRFYLGGYLSSDMKMILTSQGYLGIGTTAPTAKLQVSDGDIYIEDINNGVIMKSPNGNCWRVTIDDTGNLIKTQLNVCP